MIAIQKGVIVASYRQRGKNKLWDYRIFDKKGKVVVETSEGDYAEKEPYEVGAVKQKDGTIALKDKEGQLKVLPNTGTASTIFTTIWGIIGLIATIWGKRKFN